MLQNITLSAQKSLIEQARRRARLQNTTLNAEFRRWLEQYAGDTSNGWRSLCIDGLPWVMRNLANRLPGMS